MQIFVLSISARCSTCCYDYERLLSNSVITEIYQTETAATAANSEGHVGERSSNQTQGSIDWVAGVVVVDVNFLGVDVISSNDIFQLSSDQSLNVLTLGSCSHIFHVTSTR